MKLRILIADDEYFIRKRIIKIIDWEELNLDLVGEVDNGLDSIEILKEKQVDIAILDIKMPRLNGLDVAKYISENCPDTQIIILSGYSDFEYARTAINYSVLQYLVKPVEAKTLNSCLRKAIKNIYKIKPELEVSTLEKAESKKSTYERPSDARLVNKICKYIDENFKDSSLTVNKLANDFSLHPSYINSVFKKSTDISILSYINHKRLEHSKSLLSNTDLSIKEVALRSGFNDGFYFSKKFKSKYGINPSKFRKR